MKFNVRATVAAGALIASAGGAWADCGIESGSVRILSNDFDALHAVADWAAKCANDKVEVTKNHTEEHKNIQVPALTTNPASYTVAVVATNSIVPLLSDGLIRPLDEYVEKWGGQLQDSQKIVVDGKIMAIAFMANAQHMFYREDLLKEHGIPVPTSYDEMFAAADKLREAGVMQTPISSNYMPGWNIAAEFVNNYLATGNDFFVPGSAELAIDNEDGLLVLNNMKKMLDYMSQDWATFDSNAQKPLWEAGEAALSISWGSRAGAYIADDNPAPEIAANTAFAAAPTIGEYSIPSAALWWDGFTIAKNISDEDAEASFRAMMNGLSQDMLAANMDAAVWLIDGYEPTPAATGVIADLQAGARPYPMLPYMGLLHTALGDNLAEFLQGKESAEQALADVTAAYTTAATEAGFLN
ncbi:MULTISPECIES: ABC transporter substrate-binding protein [Mameliella]|uniref:ABC transporter substrate-binding protein n=1 Tax=Mameliella TaxID=1434019 RepID=UPI000B531323|nr:MULTISPECIES: extracellular solute-binding protein [Mameliella]MCR9273337.1 extracellular solute-binding protein [Paracoccaceae bacterium]MBY6118423.1 extracellular solute-binding protein [Mameliella alba]OWV43308.1 sugar ABC transporter substrate-binding protein [Mameliella alba]OWV58213.1 sugar ABC transporter substrate-binding protein [Mameliella alba]OWV68445.1 sugar ABC transporter substrate-binding protein [Mameliella alba]